MDIISRQRRGNQRKIRWGLCQICYRIQIHKKCQEGNRQTDKNVWSYICCDQFNGVLAKAS